MEFRLLAQDMGTLAGPETTRSPSLVVEGCTWSLTQPLDIISDSIPEYGCVSYVWGQGREPNPIHQSAEMSDHTVPSLAAAIRHSPVLAFWMDAFSVPADPVAKSATLESMGYIYGHAKTVIAVLSPSSFSSIARMSRSSRTDIPSEDVLDELNQDMWIQSVWTYQELINASDLVFVSEDPNSQESIPAVEFLNALGDYLYRYKNHHKIGSLAFRKKFLYVDAFEDLIAAYMIGTFAERSALDVMFGMDRRVFDNPKNYYYSMIGAITNLPSKRSKNLTLEALSDNFMRICEEKEDYSFIFSSNPRDERPGLTWRPRQGMLRPIIAWHNMGAALKGVVDDKGLTLKDMIVEHRATTYSAAGEKALLDSAETFRMTSKDGSENVIDRYRRAIKEMGFNGSASHIVVDTGIFFSQEDIPSEADFELWIASTVHYVFGAPALAVTKFRNGETRYWPGVYAGLPVYDRTMRKTDVLIPIDPPSPIAPHRSTVFFYSALLGIAIAGHILYTLWHPHSRGTSS